MRRAYTIGVAIGAAALLLGLAARFGGALAFTLALAAPSLDVWLGRHAAPPASREVIIRVDGGALLADVYRPARPRGALLLVHGLSRAGRRHPEMQRLARLLARHDRLVLVPHLEGLAAFRLSGREVEEIGAALRYLRGLDGRVGIAGFSFGAGPALLAAVGQPDLRVVGSFGGYADLRHVILYVTTGVHRFGGRRYATRQEEYNRWKLLALLAGFVEDATEREAVQAVAERKLLDPAAATGPLEARLGPGGRTLLALALNRREEDVEPLLDRLPPRARQALEALSPLPVVPRLPGRLLLAHGAEDDSIPFTETLHLAEAAGGRARVAILHGFHHTGPRPLWESLGEGARDGLGLLRLAGDLLTP
ncbi:MAG: hypothetical protein HY359_15545 [Candidatus Rokubacteria bacterium]|nr:hypothetical protein [Candidatus Rokubacteria bacterium]